MSIWNALEQLGQQPDPESIAPEQRTNGLLGLLAQPADAPESLPLSGSSPELVKEQSLGRLGHSRKGG